MSLVVQFFLEHSVYVRAILFVNIKLGTHYPWSQVKFWAPMFTEASVYTRKQGPSVRVMYTDLCTQKIVSCFLLNDGRTFVNGHIRIIVADADNNA